MSDCEAIRFDILKYDVYAKSPGEEIAFCRWTRVNRKKVAIVKSFAIRVVNVIKK